MLYTPAGRCKTTLACSDDAGKLVDATALGFVADKPFPFCRTDHVYLMNQRVPVESPHGVQQHRLAVYLHKLLRYDGMHSLSRATGKDKCYVMTRLHAAERWRCNFRQKASWRWMT